MKILKKDLEGLAQNTTRTVGIVCNLWLPFSINRLLKVTNLRKVI